MAQDTREATSLKQQIEGLSDDYFLIRGRPTGTQWDEYMNGKALKTLVRQRDELLEAAKEVCALYEPIMSLNDPLARLRSAVEGAESLGR